MAAAAAAAFDDPAPSTFIVSTSFVAATADYTVVNLPMAVAAFTMDVVAFPNSVVTLPMAMVTSAQPPRETQTA